MKLPREDRFESQTELKEFLREAAVSVQLAHPNIVPVYTAEWSADGLPYIAMRLMSGRTFGSFLRTGPSLRTVVEMLTLVCDAVHYAHLKGYFHRDLKPSNILLDEHGVPYVSDFGLALHVAEQLDQPGDARCSRLYAAPEQIQGRSEYLDGRCDIYAIGAILYEVLAGCPVFQGSPTQVIEQILYRPPQPPSQRRPASEIPSELETLCLQCLEKDAERRPKSMTEVSDRLRKWLRVEPSVNAETTTAFVKESHSARREVEVRPTKSVSTLWFVAGAIAIAIMGLQYFLAHPVSSGNGGVSGISSVPPGEPPLLDTYALPQKPLSVLVRAPIMPVTLLWEKGENKTSPELDADLEALTIDSNSLAICSIGKTESNSWQLTAPFSNASRKGMFGICVGICESRNLPTTPAPANCWQSNEIVIFSLDGRSWEAVRQVRFLAYENGQFSDHGTIQLRAASVSWDRDSRQLLEVTVKYDSISRVRWNGVDVPLDDETLRRDDQFRNPENQTPLNLPCRGRLGLINDRSSTTFRSVEFLQLEK